MLFQVRLYPALHHHENYIKVFPSFLNQFGSHLRSTKHYIFHKDFLLFLDNLYRYKCTCWRDYYSFFSLNRFHHVGYNILILFKFSLKSISRSIVYKREVQSIKWAEIAIPIRIIWASTSCDSPAPKISLCEEYGSLITFYFFDLIAPLTCNFDPTLSSLNSCIHKEGLFIAKYFMEILLSSSQHIVMHCSGGESNTMCLINKSF